MLNNRQKAQLKALGNSLRPIFQIGKDNINHNIIIGLDQALEAHELVKVSLLKTTLVTPNEAAIELSAQLHCEVVQIIGRTVILYKPSKKKLITLVK
ncbi:MAG: YhbY family RNA-binding protein [Erysipelotrichaceae bacterium]